MGRAFDLIVIGGGQHGLTHGAMAARKGLKTLVLEKNEDVGGLARKEEFHPRFFSAGVHNQTATVSGEIADALNLMKFGLEFQNDPGVFLADSSGRGIWLHSDAEKSKTEIAHYSKKDALAYEGYREYFQRVSKFGKRLLNHTPPNILSLKLNNLVPMAKMAFALRSLGSNDMVELFHTAPMCVADFLGNWFENDLLKAGLCGPAVWSTFTGPWSPLSTLNLFLWELMSDQPVRGGPQSVIAALKSSCKSFGGTIETSSNVKNVLVKKGRVTGVELESGEVIEAKCVTSSLDPKTTFFSLLSPSDTSAQLKQNLKNYRSRGTTAKVDFAIKGNLNWKDRSSHQFEFVRTGDTVDTVEKSFDVVKYGVLPERPTLDVFVPTVTAPELAPEGHHVMSVLVNFVPYNLKEGWNETSCEKLKNTVLNTMEDFVPGFKNQVIGSRVLPPMAIESRYGVSGGNLHHGELTVDQFLPRPVPSVDQYKTSIDGFFLCGSGTFPGGGMSLRNGALAAEQLDI